MNTCAQELDFDEFSPKLTEFLESYRETEKRKKDAKAKAAVARVEAAENGGHHNTTDIKGDIQERDEPKANARQYTAEDSRKDTASAAAASVGYYIDNDIADTTHLDELDRDDEDKPEKDGSSTEEEGDGEGLAQDEEEHASGVGARKEKRKREDEEHQG